MKAFALTSPDEPAAMADLPQPEVAPDAVGIRVRAASVNGFDVFQASGQLIGMMEHALPSVIGRDFAGVIETVGSERSDVAVGDEVVGFIPSTPPLQDGTYADVVTSSSVVLARKPAGCRSRLPPPSRSPAPQRSTRSMPSTPARATSWSSPARRVASDRLRSSSPRSVVRR